MIESINCCQQSTYHSHDTNHLQIEDECPICLEPFDENSIPAIPSSCNRHIFHHNCLIKLVMCGGSINCPMDRLPFNSFKFTHLTSNDEQIRRRYSGPRIRSTQCYYLVISLVMCISEQICIQLNFSLNIQRKFK